MCLYRSWRVLLLFVDIKTPGFVSFQVVHLMFTLHFNGNSIILAIFVNLFNKLININSIICISFQINSSYAEQSWKEAGLPSPQLAVVTGQ